MKNIRVIVLLVISIVTSNSLNAHGGIGEGFHFTENKGQFAPGVSYLCRLHLGNLFLESNKWTFDLFSPEELSNMHQKKISERNPTGIKGKNEFDQDLFKNYALNKHAYSMRNS